MARTSNIKVERCLVLSVSSIFVLVILTKRFHKKKTCFVVLCLEKETLTLKNTTDCWFILNSFFFFSGTCSQVSYFYS